MIKGGERISFFSDTDQYPDVEIPLSSHFPLRIGEINAHVMPYEVGKNYQSFVILGRKDFFEKFEVTINETGQHVMLRELHSEQVKNRRF